MVVAVGDSVGCGVDGGGVVAVRGGNDSVSDETVSMKSNKKTDLYELLHLSNKQVMFIYPPLIYNFTSKKRDSSDIHPALPDFHPSEATRGRVRHC